MRLLGKLTATVIILLFVSVILFLTLLHTRFATPVVVWTLNQLSPYPITATHVDYTLREPLSVAITQPRLQLDETHALQADRLALWLSPHTLTQWHWQFDTILIDHPQWSAATHDEATTPFSLPFVLPAIQAQRLALRNVSGKWQGLQLTDGQLEWDQWDYHPDTHMPFWQQSQGTVRLAAKQLQWQDITLHNVLIDGEHHNQTWLLHGLSAQWQHTRLNGQAIYDHQRHHVTVAQLTLSDGQWQTTTPLAQLQHDILARLPRDITATIERLDILNTSMETADFTLNQASLSLENWQWPQAVNTQTDALLSFSADSGRWHDTAFTDPLLDLAFSPNTITLQGAAVSVMEGYVQAAGSLTSHQWMLDNLSINGIKWLLPADWRTSLMAPLQQATQAPSLRIKQLAIRHTNLTDSNADWPWQISGLNIDGHDLTLMENGQWGLWHGALTSGAQLVSLNTVEMQAPWIDMSAKEGDWQLHQAILPFKDGLLDIKGYWALHQQGQPWALAVNGDSLPSLLLSRWLDLPLPIHGEMDVTGQAEGLGQDAVSLAYSLAGDIKASFRDTRLAGSPEALWQQWTQSKPGQAETVTTTSPRPDTVISTEITTEQDLNQDLNTTPQAITLSPLRLHSERGQIRFTPMTLDSRPLQATLQGEWDLAKPDAQQIQLKARYDCQQLHRQWAGASSIASTGDHASASSISVSSAGCAGNNI